MDAALVHLPCPICAADITAGFAELTEAERRDAADGFCRGCSAFVATVDETEWTRREWHMVIENLGPGYRLCSARALVYRSRMCHPRRESITCPECGRTSHNFNDVREGYCGACRGYTSRVSFDLWTVAEAMYVRDTLGPGYNVAVAEQTVYRWRTSRTGKIM